MNTITIELCAEDRARLDKIIEALTTQPAAAPAPQPDPIPQEETPANVLPFNPAPTEAQEKPPVTREAVQRLVQKLAAPGTGKKEAVRAIVKRYGERVGDIPEDKLGEVMDCLMILEEAH